tara:strand:- start:130 stop:489 length:360 start_codon:yes stop_codon:yes gene_type:complete
MANLHKLSVQEAMNAGGSGGVWTVNAVSTTGSNADVANTVHVKVTNASQLGLYSSGEIYFNFANGETNCNTSGDLKLPAETLTFITVPLGLEASGIDADIYFNHLSTSTTAHTVRIVEI